jgi:hypothetical protein
MPNPPALVFLDPERDSVDQRSVVRPPVSDGNRRLLSFVATLVSLAIIFTFLKISIENEEPSQNSTVMFTGSVPSSATVRKSPLNDPMAAFLTSPSPIQAQSAVMDRSPIPLPRPRPKRP